MNKLRIFGSIIILAVLATFILRTDLTGLQQSLSRISWGAIFGCLALVQAQIVISALRWRFTAQRLGQEITPFTSIREYYVASLLNQTLPGGMGGDALRAWRMRSNEPGGWKQPAKAIILERLSGQIAFFLLAITGFAIWPFVTNGESSQHTLHYLIFGIMLVAAFVLVAIWVIRKDAARSAFGESILDVFVRRRAWMFQGIASVAILSTYIATFLIAAQATGSSLPWVAVLTIIPFCLVAMLIPSGFGGWGTREAAAMALWPMLGASPVDGLAASITYGWLSLAGATPGIIFLLVTAFQRKQGHA